MRVIFFILLTLPLFLIAEEGVSLTSTQKAFILQGETCCYSQEVIDSVQLPTYDYQPYTIDLDLPPLREPASKLSWGVFYGLQILDVYTTERALQYNCIEELNPILGTSPDVEDIIALKVLLLGPALWYNNKYGPVITNGDLAGANYLMTAVVVNNFEVWSDAKSRDDCTKIR